MKNKLYTDVIKMFSIKILLVAGQFTVMASEATDTVTRITNPEYVEIATKDNSIELKVKDSRNGESYDYIYKSEGTSASNEDWEIKLPFFSTHKEKYHNSGSRVSIDWFDNFYVGGLIGLDRPKGMRGGWEIGVDNLAGIFWHTGKQGPVFSLGAGLGYRSTNFGKGTMLSQEGKRLIVVPCDDEITSASSRLHLFRLSVPFMITQSLGCGFALRVGAILNLNTYTSATTKIKTGNKSSKDSFHSLQQRFATPDFLGSLVLCDHLGVYVRWSPVPLFSEQWGPRFKVITVGVNYVL